MQVLDYEVDLGSKVALERLVAYENVVLPAYSRLSFVETGNLENDTDIIEKAMEENHKNKRFLEILLNKKAHTLSTEVESRSFFTWSNF